VTSDGVYFDTSRQDNYGFLARLDREGLQGGKRVALGDKRRLTDFALWKFSPPGVQRQMEWDSPWGRGFPGWHIECSAMSAHYLGPWFDIHCGGEDYIAVHHSNEIAQTQAACGTRLANIWMHGHFLTLESEKTSKPAGDFLRLESLRERGIDPLAYRYLCLTAHYRSKLRFSWEALAAAQAALERLRRSYAAWQSEADALASGRAANADAGYVARFLDEVNQDLNLPRALAVLWEVARSDLPAAVKRATVDRFGQVLGLALADARDAVSEIPHDIAALAEQRRAARAAKQWAEADRLRDALSVPGWRVEDGPQGQQLRPIEPSHNPPNAMPAQVWPISRR
jgi:cysteinyl-tRNA synthetase